MTTNKTSQLIETPANISGGAQYQHLAYVDAYDAVLNCDYAFVAYREADSNGDWRVRIDVRTRQWSTAGHIHHEAEVDAWFGEEKVSARRWSEKFVRKLL